MAANSDQIRKTIGQYIEFMNASDFDSIAELYAENATLEDPIGTEPLHGREAVLDSWRTILTNTAQIGFQLTAVRAEVWGDLGVVTL